MTPPGGKYDSHLMNPMKPNADVVVVWHDLTLDELMSRVNRVLARHNLVFADDGKPHDGYCIYELHDLERVKTKEWPEKPVK